MNSTTGSEEHARPGGRAPGKSGQSLTRPYGLKFGTNVWPGRNDQWLGGYQEHRHDADHGRDPAENHPCGFKWAIEAKRNRNAKMIVIDPRFTRTASVADMLRKFERERT